MNPRSFAFVTALALAAITVACGGYDSNDMSYNPTPTTQLAGTFVSGSSSGSMRVSFAGTLSGGSGRAVTPQAGGGSLLAPGAVTEAPAPLAATPCTGTVKLASGASVSLTGTYTSGVGTLVAQTTDGAFAFAGTLQGGVIAGTVTPAGSFLVGPITGSGTVRTYCGTYDADLTAETGEFNLVILSSTQGLLLISSNLDPSDVQAVPVTLSIAGSILVVTIPGDTGAEATATLSETAITNGTYTDGDGETGTWSGTNCGNFDVGGGTPGPYY